MALAPWFTLFVLLIIYYLPVDREGIRNVMEWIGTETISLSLGWHGKDQSLLFLSFLQVKYGHPRMVVWTSPSHQTISFSN